jgi:hypothetical protein
MKGSSRAASSLSATRRLLAAFIPTRLCPGASLCCDCIPFFAVHEPCCCSERACGTGSPLARALGTNNFRAASIKPFSCASSLRGSSISFFGSAGDGRCGNQLSSISKISVSERITERWITFCNSRMFPGQGYKLKQFEHLLADTPYVLARFSCVVIDKVFHKQGNVLSSFSKRRNFNRKNIQAVKQITAE